ncbi:large-conductance mechanosensitive channel [Endogone sp. FLAS-F59071]|nr:large-conductance mechanosensitive channel [Endogone sp. FLAS-F59071]|eukprot:RUS13139.1 large-conductance mechanosensitive channel [Endogone sp. FLAS-F59071]
MSDTQPLTSPSESSVNRSSAVDLRAAQERAAQIAQAGADKARGFFADFKAFINRGNVIDLAVGVIIGASFGAVTNSAVQDILMPFIGLATGTQFEESLVVIKKGDPPPPYTTRQQAKDAGAITVNYGNFIQQIINFILIALVLFFVIKAYAAFKRRPKAIEPTEKQCDYCAKDVGLKALRCPFCTTWLDKDVKKEEESNQGTKVVVRP